MSVTFSLQDEDPHFLTSVMETTLALSREQHLSTSTKTDERMIRRLMFKDFDAFYLKLPDSACTKRTHHILRDFQTQKQQPVVTHFDTVADTRYLMDGQEHLRKNLEEHWRHQNNSGIVYQLKQTTGTVTMMLGLFLGVCLFRRGTQLTISTCRSCASVLPTALPRRDTEEPTIPKPHRTYVDNAPNRRMGRVGKVY